MLIIEKWKHISMGNISELKKNDLNSGKVADIINVNISNVNNFFSK